MRNAMLLLAALCLFVTISDVGAVTQAAHPEKPIWALVIVGEMCVIALVWRNWTARQKS
jgi:hypothetical protein